MLVFMLIYEPPYITDNDICSGQIKLVATNIFSCILISVHTCTNISPTLISIIAFTRWLAWWE